MLKMILTCADAVARSWDGKATTERAAVVEPFEYALERTGVLDGLPAVLVSAVDALGEKLRAEPVAVPPYVTVTSVGPVLRATLDTGRLVVTIRAFDVERDPTRYVRQTVDPADALCVVLRSR